MLIEKIVWWGFWQKLSISNKLEISTIFFLQCTNTTQVLQRTNFSIEKTVLRWQANRTLVERQKFQKKSLLQMRRREMVAVHVKRKVDLKKMFFLQYSSFVIYSEYTGNHNRKDRFLSFLWKHLSLFQALSINTAPNFEA